MQTERSVDVVIIMTTVYLAFQSLSTVTNGNPGSSTHVSIFDLQYSVVIYSQMRERNSHKRALGGQPIK